MFFFLSKLIDIFLSPLIWGLALLAASVPWRAGSSRRWKRRRAFGIAGLAILLLFSTGPVANALFYRLEHASPSTYHDDVTYDAVVLLGGVTDEVVTAEQNQPAYNDNVERLLATYRVLREGKAKFAIISGAPSSPKYVDIGEARYLGHQLEEWGIPKERIVLEERARNTHENAVFSQEIARARGFDRVLVITSAFHIPRSRECFAAVGMKADFMPVDFRSHDDSFESEFLPRPRALYISTAAIREWFGRWIYRVQGYGKSAD